MARDANEGSRFGVLSSLPWWPLLAAPWLVLAVLAVWLGWRRVLVGTVLLEGLALLCVWLLNVRAASRRRLPVRPRASPAGTAGLRLANRG